MAKGKITDFVDKTAQEQLDLTIKKLNTIVEAIEKISQKKINLSGEAKDSGSLQQTTAAIEKNKKATEELTLAQKELIKVKQQTEQLQAKMTASISYEAKVNAEAREALNKRNQALRDNARVNDTAADSTARMRVEVKNLERVYDGLSQAEKKAVSGMKLKDRIIELNTAIQKNDQEVKNWKSSIGNYGQATESLRTQIRSLTQTLANMELQGKNNSKEYQTMVMHLGKLKDAVGDVQARSKFWADDQRYVTGVTQAVNGLVGAYSVFQAATGLLGAENEEFEKTMRKLMQLTVLMNGITQISTALNKDSAASVMFGVIADKAKAYWTGIQTAATGKATIAQKALNVVMAANPIGLVIAGISALVSALAIYGSKARELTDIEKERNEAMKANYKAMGDNLEIINDINKSIEDQITSLENATKTQKEMLLEQIEIARAAEKDNSKRINQTDKLTEKLKLLNEEYEKNSSIVPKNQKEAETLNNKMADLRIQIDEAKKSIDFYTTAEKNQNDAIDEFYNKKQNLIVKLLDEAEAKKKANKASKDAKELTYWEYLQMEKYTELIEKIPSLLQKDTETKKKYLEDSKAIFMDEAEAYKYMLELQGASEDLKKSLAAKLELLDYEQEQELARVKDNEELKILIISKYDKLRKEASERESKSFAEKIKTSLALSLKIKPDEAQQILDTYLKLGKDIIDGMMKQREEAITDRLNAELEAAQKSNEIEKARLDEQKEAGLLTEEEYNRGILLSEQKMNKAKNDADKKAFEDMKSYKLAELWINAAVAAISALATANNIYVGLALSAATLITAGIEADKISSQSWTPKYAKGRKDGKAEFAIVGEEGTELIKLKSGQEFLTPNKATKVFLPEGAQVIPNHELVKMMAYKQIVSGNQSNNTVDFSELKSEFRQLNATIKSKPEFNPNLMSAGKFFLMTEKNMKYVERHRKS